MKTLRILAVDDHEMITTGYKYLLEAAEFEDFTVKVETANSYETGKQKIEDSARSFKYDLILMDIQLMETHSEEPRTGEDLGILARKIVPDTKIVFMSSFSDNYRINSILKNVNPDGYMVKSEIDEKSLLTMVKGVMDSPPITVKRHWPLYGKKFHRIPYWTIMTKKSCTMSPLAPGQRIW